MSESKFVNKNIVLKNIDDNFAYSRLEHYKIIIMNINGFVNASQLCIICMAFIIRITKNIYIYLMSMVTWEKSKKIVENIIFM